MLRCHNCRNRRCLDPLLPDNVSSMLKCSPAADSFPCSPVLVKNVFPDSGDGSSCKRLSFDQTVCAQPSHGAVESEALTASPGRIVSSVGSSEVSTAASCRRRSRKFADATTWSQFCQQKAASLKSRSSEKVFVLLCSCVLDLCIIIVDVKKIVSLDFSLGFQAASPACSA